MPTPSGVTNYYSVGGVAFAERAGTGSRTNYGRDAVGSVTSTMVSDAVVNTYSYKPNRSVLAQTGSGSNPALQWVGTLGYRRSRRTYAENYIRWRWSSTQTASWNSPAPLWPSELP